jgi:phosphoglycerate dehydrogenase-like enzyme
MPGTPFGAFQILALQGEGGMGQVYRARDTSLGRDVAIIELFRESDIVSLHVPLTPETRHLIDAQALATMKRGVVLINTGRGALIDTRALVAGTRATSLAY